MLLFKDVVIDLESTYLRHTTNNIDHIGCNCGMCYSACLKVLLSKYCCWKAKMIIHGRTTCRIADHVIFLTWMPNWSFFGYCPWQPSVYVMRIIFRDRNYIDVWSMFERLAPLNEIFVNMVLPLMHDINLGTSIVK